MKKFLKFLLITILVLGLVGAAGYYYLDSTTPEGETLSVKDRLKNRNFKPNIEDEPVELSTDVVTFLMVGVDSDELHKNHGVRTDSMILTKVDFSTGEMDMLSIPRDTRVPIKGSLDKINHAHSYGGMDLTLKTVNDYLGTNVTNYVKLDYNAVKTAVDTIGGVEVKVPRRMTYDNLKEGFYINLYPGLQTLNGNEAMGLVRWRQSSDGKESYFEGDIDRIGTQQIFMKAFLAQVMDIKNITKLPSLIKTGFDSVETNLPMPDVMNGAMFAKSIKDKEIRTETIPGEDTRIDGISYYLADEKELQKLLVDMGFVQDNRKNNN